MEQLLNQPGAHLPIIFLDLGTEVNGNREKEKKTCQKTEGRVLNTFVPVRKGECHTLCGFDRPIMLRTGFPPRLAGTVWKGRVGFQMPFASSTHRKTRCSSDWQESEVLGHVSLTDRVGPGTLKARPLARRFADARTREDCFPFNLISCFMEP